MRTVRPRAWRPADRQSPAGFVPLRLLAEVTRATAPTRSSARTASGASSCMPTATAGATWRPSSPTCGGSWPRRSLPQGYSTSLEGTFQAQEEATLRIGALSLVSLALIFIVLFSRYRSAVLALIIMGNMPLALIGSVIALELAGSAALGGLDDRLHHAGRHRRAQRHPEDQPLHQSGAATRAMPFGRDLVLRGSLERLTPVLMTALVGGPCAVPLLIGAGEPGKEILHPVAVTIFGGLISSTLLDTFLTPVLFLLRPQAAGADPGRSRNRCWWAARPGRSFLNPDLKRRSPMKRKLIALAAAAALPLAALAHESGKGPNGGPRSRRGRPPRRDGRKGPRPRPLPDRGGRQAARVNRREERPRHHSGRRGQKAPVCPLSLPSPISSSARQAEPLDPRRPRGCVRDPGRRPRRPGPVREQLSAHPRTPPAPRLVQSL